MPRYVSMKFRILDQREYSKFLERKEGKKKRREGGEGNPTVHIQNTGNQSGTELLSSRIE